MSVCSFQQLTDNTLSMGFTCPALSIHTSHQSTQGLLVHFAGLDEAHMWYLFSSLIDIIKDIQHDNIYAHCPINEYQ